MKKLLNIGIPLLAVGLLAALFVLSSAYGSEDYNASVQEEQTSTEGYYVHDMRTGETSFVPYSQTDTLSGETEVFSRGYDPYSDEKMPSD